MRNDPSASPGRPTVLTLIGVILGLHALVFLAYSLLVGVPVPRGLYLGSQNLVLWILTFLMWALLLAALYVRQPGTRWVLIVFLTYAATITGIPSLITKWREGAFTAVLATGLGIATYLLVAATLTCSRNIRAYVNTERTAPARWTGIMLLAAAFSIVVVMLVFGSLPGRTTSP